MDALPLLDDNCRKLTIYFGERVADAARRFLANDLLDIFERHQVASSILLRGIEGYGLRHHLRSDTTLSLSEDPPVVAVAVDTTERISRVTEEVTALQLRGLITVERATLLRETSAPLPRVAAGDETLKLTVYVGRQEMVYRVPAFKAVCELLHRRGLAGASVLLGVDGTFGGARQRAKFFDGNADVPMMIIAVGDGDRIAAVIPELGALLHQPMLTLERVRVCKRDGDLIRRPLELPGVDASGLAMWQKIMVYTSESTLHRGAPVHRALIRRLRSAGAARGATALRGIWGFHGDHAPHGDRFLQIHRSVPVVTVIVDAPERIGGAFDVVDELTSEHGLVTSEMVPALVSAQPRGRRGGLELARHRP